MVATRQLQQGYSSTSHAFTQRTKKRQVVMKVRFLLIETAVWWLVSASQATIIFQIKFKRTIGKSAIFQTGWKQRKVTHLSRTSIQTKSTWTISISWTKVCEKVHSHTSEDNLLIEAITKVSPTLQFLIALLQMLSIYSRRRNWGCKK